MTSLSGDREVALITGAAQGIGAAIARRLAARGALVAVTDIAPRPELDELAAELGGITAPADVSDAGQMREMPAAVEQAAGPVATLVCNAAYMTMGPLTDTPSRTGGRPSTPT